ncbi:hypothetical protein ACSSS7_001456 [Eimeria intestinalis]
MRPTWEARESASSERAGSPHAGGRVVSAESEKKEKAPRRDSTDACSDPNSSSSSSSSSNSISAAAAADPCSADRMLEGPLSCCHLSTSGDSCGSSTMSVGGPQAEEGGPTNFEPASCFKPACQGPECPLPCCSAEAACLADLLHAGDSASPNEFLCHSSSTSAAHASSHQVQRQQQQHSHFHPDRGPPATALPPGKGAPGSSARRRGSRSRSPTPSEPPSHGSPRDEQQQPVELPAAAVAAAAAELEEVATSSREEGRGLHLPHAAALTSLKSEGEANAAPEAPAGLFKLRKRDGVNNLAELAREEEEGLLRAGGGSAATAGGSSPGAPSAGGLSPEVMRALRPSWIGGDARRLACAQQERQKQIFGTEEETEMREESPALRVPWFSELCFPPKEEEPWEMTYEAFVKWRINVRKREAADLRLHATRRGTEQQDGGSEDPAPAACAAPVAAAAAVLGANSCRSLSRLLSNNRVEEPPPECGAHWSRALNGARPVVLPRDTDLVTYVEIENGRRKEQHALYSRESGCFDQGGRSFRDMFDFIRWVHAEGGADFDWDSVSPVSHTSRKKKAEEESKNNEEIDNAFDPDSPPGNAVVPEADFSHVAASSPWKETKTQSDEHPDGGGGGGVRTPEKDAVNGWPVVVTTDSSQNSTEEPPWLHSPDDGNS